MYFFFYNCVSLYLVGYVLEGDECQGGAGKPHDRIEAWLKDEHKDKEIPLPALVMPANLDRSRIELHPSSQPHDNSVTQPRNQTSPRPSVQDQKMDLHSGGPRT